MIIFKDWNITATPGVIARQFDHKTRRLEMTGDMPTGWEWTAEFRYGDFMDVFLLEPMEGGFGLDLTADQLCFPGNYKIQVRGIRGALGEEIRYTNEIRVFIPENLAGTPDEEGEANWPEVTSEFKQLEERIRVSVDSAAGHADAARLSSEQAEDHMRETGKYAEQARKYADLVNPDEINKRIADKGDNLEFDNTEGLLYLTSGGERISDGIKVATSGGGGGGGGGGSENNAVMSIANRTGWIFKTMAHGSPCPITFFWQSLEEGLETGPGVLKITINSSVKVTMEVQQGEQTLDIWPWLDVGVCAVKFNVTDTYGNSRTLSFNVTTVQLTVNSYFDGTIPYTGDIIYSYTPVGYAEKTVYFILDGEEIGRETVTTSGQEKRFTIPAQSHGSHSFEVYFEATIDGVDIPSNRLKYDLICYTEEGTEPIISVPFWETTVEQFGLINVPYVVYDPQSLNAAIEQKVNGNTVKELTVGRTEQMWSYRPDMSGAVELSIVCRDVEKPITLTVTESPMQVEAATEALSLYLNAYGRSNSEADPATWVSGDIEASMTGFNFKSDGWQLDDNGVSVLRVGGDARVEIPYQIFAQDFRTTGKTIEIEFSTRDVLNYDAPIITCFSRERGLMITVQRAYLNSEQSSIGTQYKEDERVRLSFVVEKKAEHRLLLCYINGILSGAIQYPADDNFSQTAPVGISIGSSECTVDIYCIRVYDINLTRYQVLSNWIADTPTLTEKAERYERNDIYDDYGKIVISKLPPDLPYFIMKASRLPQSKGDKVTTGGSYTDLETTRKSFTFEGAQADVQGTSSAGYARKNYKLKFKGGFIQNGAQVEVYQLGSSVPTSTFTFKADVASSEGANNVELVKLYCDICPYQTPPQLLDERVRQGIDGYPMVIFHDDGENVTFIGKYNFNHDKGTPEVFGMDADDESWETKNNTSARALWKSADFSGTDWQNDYEARHPEGNTNVSKLAALAAWIVSTDTEQATGEALNPAVTYGDVTYEADTAEYRLAKFDAELGDWFDETSTIFYYLFTELFLMTDSRTKNSFPTLYDNGKWCWLPYDMDTAIGINNMGVLSFGYELEDIDLVDGAPVYNGQDSTFWKNVRATRYEQIKTMYQELRRDKLSYEDVNRRFEEHQSKWPEAIFNEDAYYKYLEPLIKDGVGSYLSMLQGSKAEQRKWWLYNRFQYMDSKYLAGDSQKTENTITVRGYAKSDITVTPYADIYASVKFGSYLLTKRALRADGSQTFEYPMDVAKETETYIYSATQISDVGDLSGYHVGYADFGAGTRLQRIKLGDGAEGYQNPQLTELTLGNNVLLKTLDIRNCINMGTANQKNVDVSGCTNIEEIYATGTALQGITLPNGGILKKLHLPGTIANLAIRNQPLLMEFVLEDAVLDAEGNQPMTTLWLENPSASVPVNDLLARMQNGGRIRMIDVNFTFADALDLMNFKNQLDRMTGIDENGNNTAKAQVSGLVWVPSLTKAQLNRMTEAYPELAVAYGEIRTTYTVRFFNTDGLLLETHTNVARGSNVKYSGGALIYPGEDAEYFEHIGWSPDAGFVTDDMDCYPVFRDTRIQSIRLVERTISGSYYNDRVTTLGESALNSCNYLESVTFPNVTRLEKGAIQGCSGLTRIDLGKATTFGQYATYSCPKLETLIIRSNAVATSLQINGSLIASGTGYIYVPSAVLAGYQTKYTAFSAQFRAIEDYPDITGG